MPNLSDLDRDLGLTRPCDLNVFWPLATALSRRGKKSPNVARLLRLRYSPGGRTQRTYRQIGALLGIDEVRAHTRVRAALYVMRHSRHKKLYQRRNGHG